MAVSERAALAHSCVHCQPGPCRTNGRSSHRFVGNCVLRTMRHAEPVRIPRRLQGTFNLLTTTVDVMDAPVRYISHLHAHPNKSNARAAMRLSLVSAGSCFIYRLRMRRSLMADKLWQLARAVWCLWCASCIDKYALGCAQAVEGIARRTKVPAAALWRLLPLAEGHFERNHSRLV